MGTTAKRKRSGVKTTEPTKQPVTALPTKKIPGADIKMTCVLFGDGANGMRLQEFQNEEYGIYCSSRKKDRNSPWKQTWTSHATGTDHEFNTFAALRQSYNRLVKK